MKAKDELKELQQGGAGEGESTEGTSSEANDNTSAVAENSEGTEQVSATEEERASSKSLTKHQSTMLAKLKAQKHVPIHVPFDRANPKDKVQIVGVNGVIFAIPRGKTFSVPESVAKTYLKSVEKTNSALDRIRMTEMGEDDREIEIRR